MDSILLYTGLSVTLCTRKAVYYGTKLIDRLDEAMMAYDAAHKVTQPCTGNIMCNRDGVRHRVDCPGKPEIAIWDLS